jgi:hypothetical protein
VQDGQHGGARACVGAGKGVAQALQFLLLGGEPGDGPLPEHGMPGDDGIPLGQAMPEGVVVGFEAGDLGVARVGGAASVAERGEEAARPGAPGPDGMMPFL